MMNYKEKIQHPWQSGPTELIAHAIEHLQKATEFDNRIAFLLFDVGVETLFKTYLLLPDEVTGTKSKFEKRKAAANGVAHTFDDEKKQPRKDWKFHDLIKGIGEAKPEIKIEFDLNHVEFFHEKRNALYHDGNGITIESDNLRSYSSIAVNLLKYLLDIDLSEILSAPDVKANLLHKEEQLWKAIEAKRNELLQSRKRLGEVARYAAEIIAPELAKSGFIRTLRKHYSKSEEAANSYLSQSLRKAFPDDCDITLLGDIEPRDIFYDNNLLYLLIVTVFVKESDISLGIYELSQYDPVEIFDQVDLTTDEYGHRVSFHHLSIEEYAKKITDWLLDNLAQIEKNITILDAWLDRKNDQFDRTGE